MSVELCERSAEVVEGVRVFRVELRGALERLDGVGELSEREEREAEVVLRVLEVGLELDGLAQRLDRVGVALRVN